MKKFISLILVAFLIFIIPVSANSEIKVTIDGRIIFFDTAPINFENRNLVPLRKIFEELGAEVTWDGDTRTAISKKAETTVLVQIDNTEMYINDEAKILDVPAKLMNNRTLVPTRAVAEAFGCDVSWDGDNRTVIIKTPKFMEKEAVKKEYVSDFGYKISYLDKYNTKSENSEFIIEDEHMILSVSASKSTETEKFTYEELSENKALLEQEFKAYIESETDSTLNSCVLEIRNNTFSVEIEYSNLPLKQILFYGEKGFYCVTLGGILLSDPTNETVSDFHYMAYSLMPQ